VITVKVRAVFRFFDTCVNGFLFLGVIIMIVVGMAQIIARYVLQASLSWSEELMRFLYVWLTMIGVTIAIKNEQFTTIEILSKMVGEKIPKVGGAIKSIVTVLQVFFFVILVIFGTRLVVSNLNQISPAIGMQMGIAYCALPAGGILGLLYCLISIWERYKGDLSL
jgi:TRAP-type C4-dicarboxylate transport system permease small subunit